jgi:threonine/homoserine/homoserine lactone efflux protein
VEALALGVALGLGAGLSPGPLLGLVIANALRGGFRAGALTALAPLLTDALVVAACVTVLAALPTRAVAALGVAGAVVVLGIAVQTWVAAHRDDPVPTAVATRTVLVQSSLVNVLSPHPWLFWLTAGGPLLIGFLAAGTAQGVAFVVGFYALLVGTKVAVAALVGGAGRRLSPRAYRSALLGSALILALSAVVLVQRFLPDLLG